MNYDQAALEQHKKLQGKIELRLKDDLDSRDKLSTYYTPGVAAVSRLLAKEPAKDRAYTWRGNTVAVVSDGSAVLGLGDIGPAGALPVMEGKAMIFKQLAGIDAVPIVLDANSLDEIVAAVTAIAPSFGGINLEDIAAPKCFEIEQKLVQKLDIPVMHDDQHGTAVVVLAGLINATALTRRKLTDSQIVVVGAGAAGTAIVKLLHDYGAADILVVDSRGIISTSRKDLNDQKQSLLNYSNPKNISGDLARALVGADIFIGVSLAGLLNQKMISTMKKDPIIFAMANPTPEIMPNAARAAGAAVVATGRSDFANQVNNALAFPGIFRGALDRNIKRITTKHKIAAAEAIAALVKNPTIEKIIPSVFEPDLAAAVAKIII